MYEAYWELREKPFENTPDPRFLYHSPQHEEGLMRLVYAVKERKGAAMLTGVFGCGKTVIAQALLDELDEDIYKIAFINNPQLTHIELLMDIASRLGVANLPNKRTEVLTNLILEALEVVLRDNLNDGKETVVIIDEAHIIEDKMIFEELRLLLNLQLRDRFLLTLLLLGQPELVTKVESIKPFAQRIAISYHLDRLNEEDTTRYIMHRLKVAEQTRPIFTDRAVKLVYERSAGIPRRINQISDMSLFTGYLKKQEIIDQNTVLEAIKGLKG